MSSLIIDRQNYDCDTLVKDYLYCEKEHKLIPEPDKVGNIEYKLRLDLKDSLSLENMESQMEWRMREGMRLYGVYEANYILGIYDSGTFSDMTKKCLDKSIPLLNKIIKRINSRMVGNTLHTFKHEIDEGDNERYIRHVIVRKDYTERHVPEINLMLLGPSNVGKTSLMGHMTYEQVDDGNGHSRKLILRHLHERNTGNTSSCTYDTIGFKGNTLINYGSGLDYSQESIYHNSDRLINIIDLPGDMGYSKTIIFSVTSIVPDMILICIQSDNDKQKMEEYIDDNKEYYTLVRNICNVYDIQPIFIFTKADMDNEYIYNYDTDNESETNMDDIDDIYYLSDSSNEEESNGGGYISLDDETMREKEIKDYFNRLNMVGNVDFNKSRSVRISNIYRIGFKKLSCILSELVIHKNTSPQTPLFLVNNSFKIPDTKIIYHGILRHGIIKVGDLLTIYCRGKFYSDRIKSIHRKTLDVDTLYSGESGSITICGSHDRIMKDKTLILCDASRKKQFVKRLKCMPHKYVYEQISDGRYTLFMGNQIIPVMIKYSNGILLVDTMKGYYMYKNEKIGILKINENKYCFIEIIK